MIQISQDSTLPLYQRVVQAVCDAVLAGQLQPGEQLPARRILADELGVNMVTVRSAYERLEQQGIVVSRQGAGTFICPDALALLQAGGRSFDTITVVIGADHLSDCKREAIHIISDILSGLSEQLGSRVGRYVYVSDINAHTMRHVTDQSAVVLYRLGKQSDEAYVRDLQKRGIPVLIAWGHHMRMGLTRIHFDTYTAAALGPRHLVDCGYRRIGYLGVKNAADISLTVKFLQFTNVLQDAGLDLLARDVKPVRNNVQGEAYHAMTQILASGDPPEAMFIDSDYKAMEAMLAIKHAGLNVPEDIGVVSFDGFTEAALHQPALTTVHIPRRAIGRRVGELLTHWPSEGMKPVLEQLPVELITGATTRMATRPISSVAPDA